MAELEAAVYDMTNNPWARTAENPTAAVGRYNEQREFWLGELSPEDASVFEDRYPERAIPRVLPHITDAGLTVSVKDHVRAIQAEADMVNHPPHYTSDPSGVECITITRHRNFNIGNAIKYLWRQGLKDDPALGGRQKQVEDLKKAVWYIEDEIKRIEALPE